jgi:mRNA interferase MazF
MADIKRGDIVVANLEHVMGSEQGGIRPVLIIQNNLGNKYSPTTIIAPITSSSMDDEYPTNVFILKKDSSLNKDSTILLNQIRTVDKKRLIKKVGSLDIYLMSKVNLAIKISLGLD